MMRVDEGQQNRDEAVNIIEFFTLLLLNSLLISHSLSLWGQCENPAQNEQFVPSALKSITSPCMPAENGFWDMQEMPKGQRETCVNSKERMNEFRRDKKKKKGKRLKSISLKEEFRQK